jgi:hypothetical protein
VNGGFIPQAKQGGRLVDGVAVPGSKVGGTGFENEQMGQIQVAFTGFGFGDDLLGDADCGSGEEDMAEGWETDALAASPFDLPAPPFAGLGHSVIFGEDFRNPAYADASKQLHLQQFGAGHTYLVLHAVNLLQLDANRAFPRVVDGNVANPVGRQVRVAILVVWDFVFPGGSEDQRGTGGMWW